MRATNSSRRVDLGLALAWALVAFPTPVAAAAEVELGTPYPAVAVAPGSKVSFDVTVRTDVADRVDLAIDEVPADWIASLRGEGFVVDGVQTTGDDPVELTLDVTVPDSAPAGTQRVVVAARSGQARDTLALDIRVEETAAGQVSLTSSYPELRGASDSTYRFSLRLENETAEDLTFALQARGPDGWRVEAKPTSQAQAASAVVQAGSNSTIDVTADVPAGTEAGRYPIVVEATSADRTVQAELAVEVIGSFDLTVATPDGRANARGNAGSPIEQPVVVKNDGTAALEDVTLSATSPTGWRVTFDQETITVPPGQEGRVMASITPSGDAIAGDYVVTIRASNDLANGDIEMRITVETSLVWGVLGIGLILAVVVAIGWMFRRYGRR